MTKYPSLPELKTNLKYIKRFFQLKKYIKDFFKHNENII